MKILLLTQRLSFIVFLLLWGHSLFAQSFTPQEIARWQQQAQRVTIIRDQWGIPHIFGQSDADAVFGLLFAQCEDDFKRVEMNYIEKLGRMAEVKGEASLYEDLLIGLVIDSAAAVNDYQKAPRWLKSLLDAYADGINYYLHKHPEVKPVLLSRFQPWYPLLWTDGSIGAISTADISVGQLKDFYSGISTGSLSAPPDSPVRNLAMREEEIEPDPTGSNGFAFAPSITESGKAILYINPHVTFYFRPEVHVISEEGLNAYGAVTWGQFFVYQGFNEKCGWMHTSSRADVSDAYAEKVSQKNGKWMYEYEGKLKPVTEKKIVLRYRSGGQILSKTITAYFTHHGPVLAQRDGKWLSLRANNRSMNMLIQSWQRTKATSFAEFQQTMDLLENTSNNTVYADAEGNIAYWHGNFMPRRDPAYDWSAPVDGTTKATEWKGLHPVKETVHQYNPENGWLQNCNATPFTMSGKFSPKREAFPSYMAPDGENFRGINAVRVLEPPRRYDLDAVIAAGYDRYMAAFAVLGPALVRAYDQLAPTDTLRAILAEPIALFRHWDYYSSEKSITTTLAIEWGYKTLPAILQIQLPNPVDNDQVGKTKHFAATATPAQLLAPMAEVIRELEGKFGRWAVLWGEINRFQRISGEIEQVYRDDLPSVPVPFASSVWGTLPSYTARYFAGTQKRYGVNGNSFVCAVEFGERIRAKSLLAGGQSGDPQSPHFADQLRMYAQGEFKDVLFYKEDILKHAKRTYKP